MKRSLHVRKERYRMDLRHNRLGAGVRLEQERIDFLWLEKALHLLKS